MLHLLLLLQKEVINNKTVLAEETNEIVHNITFKHPAGFHACTIDKLQAKAGETVIIYVSLYHRYAEPDLSFYDADGNFCGKVSLQEGTNEVTIPDIDTVDITLKAEAYYNRYAIGNKNTNLYSVTVNNYNFYYGDTIHVTVKAKNGAKLKKVEFLDKYNNSVDFLILNNGGH